ncbi:hypothetical protein E5161_11450 [Cohnella pontilimi]|uniref:Uncharacterized protein n=1 Tax=Cohnella pontilimi TaxID=2564100 RepID=A0A4U0FES2_9BACL|nr:hypothetical protein [Cohnella pontilimi]TJY41812.1 hypothetical protein E5161_11450 [Cohnella pontilimi]
MIGIAAIFLLIGYMEWAYLRRERKSKRTVRIVIGLDVMLIICSEAVYFTRNADVTAGMILNALFTPIQRLLFVGT